MPNLTRSFIAKLPNPERGDAIYWDSDHKSALKGFGIRVKASGVKSFVIQYRNKHGTSRRLTIGQFGALGPETARKVAKGHLGNVAANSADPAAEKRDLNKSITVGQLCDQYLKANENLIKSSTLAMDRSRIECHVKPLLGSKRVVSLTHGDIEKFLFDIAEGKTAKKLPEGEQRSGRGGLAKGGAIAASRTVGMLGTILQRAVRDGVRSDNPARKVRRAPDRAKKPPFSFELLGKIGTALKEAEAMNENRTGILALRTLMLTGCRRMEVLALQKSEVDLASQCFRFIDTKSGPQIRPIGSHVVKLIKSSVVSAAPYVFPSDRDDDPKNPKHFVGLPAVWGRVCTKAEVECVSIHGLRHWFASVAAEMNYSELTIAGLLGHKVKGVTSRYATAPDSALIAAANAVSERIATALGILLPEQDSAASVAMAAPENSQS